MNKHLTVLVIAVLLICVGLSGCITYPGNTEAVIPSPKNNESTDIQLVSQNIEYFLDGWDNINYEGIYNFSNPTNKTIIQTVVLDFPQGVPDRWFDISPVQHGSLKFKNKINKTRIHPGVDPYSIVEFDLSFDPYESITLKIEYSNIKFNENDDFFSKSYSIKYRGINGTYWNKSIENTSFTFYIRKKYYDFGLEGFNLEEVGHYILATKSYENWTSEDFIVNWGHDTNNMLSLLFLLIIGIITAIAILTIFFKRKKSEKGDFTRHEESYIHCSNCGRCIPFDTNVCPYCNKKYRNLDDK